MMCSKPLVCCEAYQHRSINGFFMDIDGYEFSQLILITD
jgi:hypothetical protein